MYIYIYFQIHCMTMNNGVWEAFVVWTSESFIVLPLCFNDLEPGERSDFHVLTPLSRASHHAVRETLVQRVAQASKNMLAFHFCCCLFFCPRHVTVELHKKVGLQVIVPHFHEHQHHAAWAPPTGEFVFVRSGCLAGHRSSPIEITFYLYSTDLW